MLVVGGVCLGLAAPEVRRVMTPSDRAVILAALSAQMSGSKLQPEVLCKKTFSTA